MHFNPPPVLNFPLYYDVTRSFTSATASFKGLIFMIGEVRPICHISMPPAKADGVPIALIPSAQMASKMADTSVLGGFVSNHDGQFWFACMFIPLASPDRIFPGMTVPRARSRTTDDALLANMFTYSFVADGVPIWYYGDEQGGDGVEDPKNREALWELGKSAYNVSPVLMPDDRLRHHES